MNTIGFKAFLRAIAIFASVYLVKIAIEVIPIINGIFLKVLFTIGVFVAILLINIIPGIIPSIKIKRKVPDKDRNSKE